ncbi:hypothetical protein SMMN14_03740 [Sphaerulina musiva]
MHLVGRLDTVVPEDISAMARLDEIQQALIDWQVEDVTATTYCPTRTALEDEALHQVYLHMRLAALAVSLWQALSESIVAHDSSIGATEPTRDAKSMGHPITQIAALVAADG